MAKTLNEKLAAATALVAKYTAEIQSIAIVNNVAVGDAVIAKYGRGEKVRALVGPVIAVVGGEGVKSVVILNEADSKPYTVSAKAITENASALTRAAESGVDAGETVVEDEAEDAEVVEASEADVDPLSAE